MTNKPMLSVERELLEIYTGRKEGDWVEAGHELRALLDAQHAVCSNGILCQNSKCAEYGGNGAYKPAAELPPMNTVEGDKLPPIGGKVFIHLSSSDSWVGHTVAGYYVWNDLQGDTTLHRVFVRVRDSDGYLNARLLKDIRLSAEG